MPTFTPPNQDAVPPVLPPGTPGQTSLSYKLFSHYRMRPEGRNVYIYSDGSVSENDPDGNSTLWRDSDRTPDSLGAPTVTFVAYGGHDGVTVTQAQADLLTAAGYGAYIS